MVMVWRKLTNILTGSILAVAGLLLASCDSGEVCEPGSVRVCYCNNGASGLAKCKSDGSGWEECVCNSCQPTNHCAELKCHQGDLWCYNDCNKPDHVREHCGPAGCSNNACNNRSCEKHQFKCDNNTCIDEDLVCNGKDDCGDASDEADCQCDLEECASKACFENDIWCYNSCGGRIELYQDCEDSCGNASCQLEGCKDQYEDNNSQATAVALSSGQTLAGLSICPADDEDWFSFDVGYSLNMVTITVSETDADLVLHVYDATGQEIGKDDDGGEGRLPAITLRGIPNGTYYVKLTSYNRRYEAEAYSITVSVEECVPSDNCVTRTCNDGDVWCVDNCGQLSYMYESCGDRGCAFGECVSEEPDDQCVQDPFEPNNTSESATPLLSAIMIDLSLCPELDQDWFVFDLDTSYKVHIETSGDDSNGDTAIYLYDQNLTYIEYDDDSGTGRYSKLAMVLNAGRYFLKVVGYNGAMVKQYTIYFEISNTDCTVYDECATLDCYENDVWCFNNCGQPSYKYEECENGCYDGYCNATY